MSLVEKVARKLADNEREDLRRFSKSIRNGSLLGVLSPLGGFYAGHKAKDAAVLAHGKDWRNKIGDSRGSMITRHPIATAFVPFGSLVSGLRASKRYKEMARKGDTNVR